MVFRRTLLLWIGVLGLAGAVWVFADATAYVHSLPAPPVDEEGYALLSDPLHDAALMLSVVIWQLSLASLNFGWRRKFGSSDLLWIATAALALSPVMFVTGLMILSSPMEGGGILAVLLVLPPLPGMVIGLACTIRLIAMRNHYRSIPPPLVEKRRP